MSSTDMNATPQAKAKPRKVGESMILRLSRGRSLKITFRPRIRVAKLLVKLLAIATGLFTSVIGSNAFAAPPVNALPTGGQVVHGSSTIQQAGNVLNINQASQKTIINWQSFDIGAQASVNFYQPNASAVALNRVLGDNASQIFGKLNANGQVFLLNPHGTLFAPGSQVNVGGLLNSTMQMTDENFINGNFILTNPGNGILDNQGTINAQSIVFAGNNITNSGNMIATSVSLVAGNTVAVDLSGDGLIRARVQNPAMQASISNSGLIDAVQQVTMSAGQVKDTLNSLVNNTGIVRATGLVNEGGVITLQAGKALNSGSLDASSATGLGGKVAMLGEHVGVTGTGSIDASGKTGGGTILVGGDFQGKNAEVQNANRTFFGKDASLNADATDTGNGGKIIVWADDVTRGYGNISARGGDISGNGGFVEVSGKRSLDYQATTDTRAPNGNIGTLLLDPDNIIIDASGDPLPISGFISFGDSPSATITLANTFINNSSSNVVLQANFNINFNAPINMTGAGVGLTAQAGSFLTVNSGNSITTNGGAVSLTAGDTGSSPINTVGSLILNAGIDTTGAGTAPTGGNVTLTNNLSNGTTSTSLNANINAGSNGNINITDNGNGGNIDQISGTLTGNKLTVSATHNVTLNGANQLNGVEIQTSNAIPTLSNIQFNNTRNLTIDGLAVSASGGGNGGNITVTNAGNIVQNGNISTHAGNVSLSATGDILSTGLGTIDTSASNGNISLSSLSDIGTDTQNIRINPGTGNVNISASDNVYINQIGSALNTSKYVLSTNLVQAIISLKSDTGINIDSFSSTNQFTNDDNFVFTATGGNINISTSETLTANLVRLNSGAGGIIGTGGISTNNLAIESEGTVTLTSNNQVNNLAANVTGIGSSFTLNNSSSSLSITSLNGINGITTNDGAATIINQSGGISVLQDIDLGNADLTLRTTSSSTPGMIFIDGKIIAHNTTLSALSASGDININKEIEASGHFTATAANGSVNIALSSSDSLQSAGNIRLQARDDVIINGDITHTGTTAHTFDVLANRDITIEGGSAITSPDAAMTVTLTSDTDLNNIGFISLKNDTNGGGTGVDILSNGGNISLSGGSGVAMNNSTLRTNATGTINIEGNVSNANIGNRGVVISASTVESVNGNITITGDASASTNTSGSDSDGVLIEAGSLIITQGIGNIDIVGKSAVGGTSQSGIAIADAPTEIDTHGTGNITLDGVSNGVGATSFGIDIYDNALVEAEGGGNIKITGQANNFDAPGLAVESGSAIKTSLGGGLDIRAGNSDTSPGGANHIELAGSSIEGSSSSLMVLRTIQLDVGIAVGGDGSTLGAFNLSDNDLDAITGFGALQIGDNIHTGSFTVSNLNTFSSTNQQLTLFSNSIDFTTPTTINSSLVVLASVGDVNLNGLTSTNRVEVIANNNITALPGTEIIAGVQGAVFEATNGNITLSSVNTSGNLKAVANGNITINSGAQIQGDKILLAAQTGNFINNAGSTALFATNHWTVVSQSPSLDTRGGLVSNFKQYNTTYVPANSGFSQPIQGTGNGFVYAIAPELTTTLVGSPNAISKVYNANDIAEISDFSAANFNVSGTRPEDTFDDIDDSIASATYIDKNVGIGKTVAITGFTINITDTTTGAQVFGYINQTGNTLTANIGEITQASLTLTGQTANSRVYDGTNSTTLNGGTLSGVIGTDVVTLTNGIGIFADKNVGTSKAVTVSGTSLGGTDGGNYTVTNPTGLTANITPRALTVSGQTADNKVYDATNTATITGGSLVNAVIDDFVFLTNGTGTFVDKNVGTGKAVTVTGTSLTGADAINYTITDPTGITANITPATLELNAVADSRTYNALTSSSGTVTKVGLQGSDTVTGLAQSFDSKNVGTRTLSVNAGYVVNDGNSGLNYTITTNTATGSITQATLALNAVADSRTYNALTSSTGTVTLVGLQGSDTVTGLAQSFDSDNAGARTLSVNSGYVVNDGNGGLNYAVTTNTASGSITQAALALNAVSDSRVYNALTDSSASVNVVGLQGADTIAGAFQTFDSKNAGARTLIVNSGYTIVDGNGGANYIVTTNTAAGSITPASISSVSGITANSKTYDGTTAATLNTGSASFSGKFTGDSLTVASATGAFTDKNAGIEKSVNVTGIALGGADAANYTLANTSASAIADITPRDLTVSAQGINKLFDGTTVAQVILTDNRIAGDNLTITNSSANFADAEVGINKQIDVLGITIDSGTDAGNYNLVNTDAIAFADIFKEDGTKETNLTETNVIDSTQNLALALTPIQVKILNPDGSESVINVDVPKGKVLSCK